MGRGGSVLLSFRAHPPRAGWLVALPYILDIVDKELTMDCKVCGCAACYYNDCCDHKNPAPITEDVGYLDLFNEFLNESELPSYEKIVTKKKETKREM